VSAERSELRAAKPLAQQQQRGQQFSSRGNPPPPNRRWMPDVLLNSQSPPCRRFPVSRRSPHRPGCVYSVRRRFSAPAHPTYTGLDAYAYNPTPNQPICYLLSQVCGPHPPRTATATCSLFPRFAQCPVAVPNGKRLAFTFALCARRRRHATTGHRPQAI
jgi:hypothetical protein